MHVISVVLLEIILMNTWELEEHGGNVIENLVV